MKIPTSGFLLPLMFTDEFSFQRLNCGHSFQRMVGKVDLWDSMFGRMDIVILSLSLSNALCNIYFFLNCLSMDFSEHYVEIYGSH